MEINNWIKDFKEPLIIAGPCSAESEKQLLTIAEQLPKDKVNVFRAGIWKPRTKPNCFEGVGAIGLNWLAKVREEFGFKITTEIANVNHARLALEYDLDILWIGARTTVNPFQIQEIAEALRGTDKVVLVKNPINPDLELWIGAMERLAGQGIKNLGVIHRGFSAYKKDKYRNQPQWQIPLDLKNKLPEMPIICDPSHIAGRRDLIQDISQKAMNFGFQGLMIETHHTPDEAWSDAKQQITPQALDELISDLMIRATDDSDSDYMLKLAELRNKIDDTDDRILELLNERMDISKTIGTLKRDHNVTVFQPKRWNLIQEQILEKASKYGLSEEFVNRFLTAVHQESIKIQNHIMSPNQES